MQVYLQSMQAHRKSFTSYLQMGHATAEAVVSAGLELVPWSFTGESEAVVVGNIGVSGIPVQLIGKKERQDAMQRVKDEYPGLVMIDFTLPGAVNGNLTILLSSRLPVHMHECAFQFHIRATCLSESC